MFFLWKASTIHISNFCSGMPLRKVHEPTFLWSGLPGALLKKKWFWRVHYSTFPPLRRMIRSTPSTSRCPISADCKRGRRKGAMAKNLKNRQKVSKKFFDTFRQFSRRAKNIKNRQKVSKSFSTLFDNFRAAPFFRPLLQSAGNSRQVCMDSDIYTAPYLGKCSFFETAGLRVWW